MASNYVNLRQDPAYKGYTAAPKPTQQAPQPAAPPPPVQMPARPSTPAPTQPAQSYIPSLEDGVGAGSGGAGGGGGYMPPTTPTSSPALSAFRGLQAATPPPLDAINGGTGSPLRQDLGMRQPPSLAALLQGLRY